MNGFLRGHQFQKRYTVDSEEFSRARALLNKTQKEMAQLLGTSLKAIHSYEQGWRSIPTHVERQIFFLLARKRGSKTQKPCWIVKQCSPTRRKQCPAWEYQAGKLCWFINGTICECQARKSWKEKMKICRQCDVLASLL